MHDKASIRWFVSCGLLGFFVFHPMIMIIARFMSHPGIHVQRLWRDFLVDSILTSYSLVMLPWGIAFSLLSAMAGFLYARKRRAQEQEAKLRGVMELAGAACHELNQPMQVVLGYADILSKEMPHDDLRRKQLAALIGQIDKMSLILNRIQTITKYETQDYLDGIKIINIEKASGLSP